MHYLFLKRGRISKYEKMNLPDKLIELDRVLFTNINGKWHIPILDEFLPFMREPMVWVPLYFFLIVFTVANFKQRGIYWVLCFAITMILSDYISSTLIKQLVMRQRPCTDPSLISNIRLLVNACPGNPGFPSSHAVNHFAASIFILTTFKRTVSKWSALLLVWAFMISYAQVYVGVHFPFDVTCGAIMGCLFGYWPAKLFNKNIGLLHPEIKT